MRVVGIHYTRWASQAEADIASLVQKARHLQYDQLEVDGIIVQQMSPWGRKRLGFEARNHQIDISYSLKPPAGYDLSSLDEDVRRHALTQFQNLIRTIGEMGGGSLNGPLYTSFPVQPHLMKDKQRLLEQSIKSLRSLTPLAQDEDVVLNIRPVNRYEHFLIPTAGEALSYVHAVNHPNCGIDLDTFEMNLEEDDLKAAILQAGIFLHCLHIRENNQKMVGLGALDWKTIRNALDEIYYKGPLVHMPSMFGEVSEGPLESRRIRNLLCNDFTLQS
ncbi:MAG: sugar phosphate isomerase/epimerase [Spirochaetales bacterium]|nr:sugar phosphate isomerase/epimerase [Spirochaetales bacterium]